MILRSMTAMAEHADVLVCGAGPVGLLIGLDLAQNGVSTVVIEKRERQAQERLGRACTLYPRTVELLEGVGVVEEMLQVGFHGRSYAMFKDGKRVMREACQDMFPTVDRSFHNYLLNIRQRRSEDIFHHRYCKHNSGQGVQYGWKITAVELEDLQDGYNLTAAVSHVDQGERKIRCKNLVGCDGGKSTVRDLLNVAMEGNDTTHRWVRVDGKFNTDFPEPNIVSGTLETSHHGNVLWAKLDGDAHRIGFALTSRLQEKYPGEMTEEQAILEAKEAMSPFSLEVERLDWWTQYNIKQKVAKAFQIQDYIFLAGDAAHTHSSAFAQGMNTGVHDAINLSWKLAGTIKGWYKSHVLPTYASERYEAALQVVSVDRLAAAAVSGDVPEAFARSGLSNTDALGTIYAQNLLITTGLGISYQPSCVVASDTMATSLIPGRRSPDALLKAPGAMMTLRLHDIVNHKDHKGEWAILVFAGYLQATKIRIQALRDAILAPGGLFSRIADRAHLATLVIGHLSCPFELFEGPALGKLYYDGDAMAHDRYCVYPDKGAVVVVRPDGVLAFAAGLDDWHHIEGFLDQIFS